MNIVERIFYLLGINGKSASELGDYIGVKPSSITGWKKGSYPSSKYIQKIAEFFDVSVSYLILGYNEDELGIPKNHQDFLFKDPVFLMYEKLDEKNKIKIEGMIELKLQEQKETQEKTKTTQTKIVPLPYEHIIEETPSEYLYEVPYRGAVAAGTPLHHFSDLFEEEEVVRSKVPAQYAWRVFGQSMEPLIQDGEMIFTNPVDPQNLHNGDLVIVLSNDGYNCKRIYHDPKKELVILKSENPDKEKYPDQKYYYGEGLDTFLRIEGRVI